METIKREEKARSSACSNKKIASSIFRDCNFAGHSFDNNTVMRLYISRQFEKKK